MLSFPYFWVGVEAVRFGKFFSIRKTYFLQVKRLILVGTLEKCAFLSLLILKSYSTCGVGYDRKHSAKFPKASIAFSLDHIKST
ncbi:hypothetical protein LEP1GSC201_3961 [Leptospira interrogans serovar Pomona str. Fox 32256]|nr:hypothetical protein LEP1GSC201_3961 [Leptospira interrogans serovar Pomona str. Fox 32256]